MSKLAHSNDEAMTEIETRGHIADGNADLIPPEILAKYGSKWPQEEIAPGQLVDVDPACLQD